MSVLARVLRIDVLRHRRELEQRRRRLAARLILLDDTDDLGEPVSTATEPPARSSTVVPLRRLEHPAGGGRRETR